MTESTIADEQAPIELRRTAYGAQLVVLWRDGSQSAVAAQILRAACRCAHCSAYRLRGTPETILEPIRITALAPIGDYAVNVVFSDDHARGIFPWAMLRALGEPSSGN